MRKPNLCSPLVAALLALAGPGQAYAQDAQPTARLRVALLAMPANAVQLSVPILAAFVDPGAAPDPAVAAGSLTIGRDFPPLAALASGGAEAWSEAAGLSADDIGSFLSFGEPPLQVTIWGDLPDGGRTLRPKLEELGFAPVEGMTGVYGNGEPLVPDLVNASQSDPWRGRIGQASFIAFDNGTIIQAATPELLDTVRAADQSTGDLTFVVAALGGIDAAVAQGTVREAVLFSAAAGLQASPLADLLATTRSIEEVKETMEQRLDMPQSGVPPYLGGLLVAAEIAGTPAMVISLVYPDCTLANSAAEAMVTLWQTEQVGGTTLAERASGAVTPGSIAGPGLCSAILTIEGDADEDARILPNLLFGALYQRDFPLLRTAMP